MSIKIRYTLMTTDGSTDTVEVEPATTAKYVAKRIAEAIGISPNRPWVLVSTDGPMRPGKRLRCVVVDDDHIAAELDLTCYYTIGVLPKDDAS